MEDNNQHQNTRGLSEDEEELDIINPSRSKSPSPPSLPKKTSRREDSPKKKESKEEQHRRRERSRSPHHPRRPLSPVRRRRASPSRPNSRSPPRRRHNSPVNSFRRERSHSRGHTSSSPRRTREEKKVKFDWKTTTIVEKPFGGKRSVIILTIHNRDERHFKAIFQRHGYQIFDYTYPFRIASKTILRQNHGYKQSSMFSQLDTEKLATFLGKQTADFMTDDFKSNFVFDYFEDWFRQIPAHQQDRVVICGISGQDYAFKPAIQKLRDMGAIQLCGPDVSQQGDYHIAGTDGLDNFLRTEINAGEEITKKYYNK